MTSPSACNSARLRAAALPPLTSVSSVTGVRVESQRQLLAMMERASLFAVLLGLLLAALAAWLAARLIVARLQTTIATLDAVQAGDLASRVPDDRTGDAFDTLGSDINRTLDRLAALIGELQIATDSLAHDLKSPLTRMRVSLEQAMAQVREPSAQESIERALAESERLMAIVHTALSISRAEAGIGRENVAAVDLGEMTETIAEIYAPLIEEHQRSLTVVAAPAIVEPVDRQLLGQAIGSLIDNAVRYGDGAIQPRLAAEAGGFTLSVQDAGAGIPTELRAEALRRFARLDAARSGPGAGLGLSLVQAVAHLHGGTVELRDAGPGLIVAMHLPVMAARRS
jgi:signal transduction histidine kinase